MDEYAAFTLAEFHFSNTDIDWAVFVHGNATVIFNSQEYFDSSDCWLSNEYQ